MKNTVQYSHYPISGAVVETGGRYLDFRFFSPYEIKMPSFYFDIDERKNCQQLITDVQVFKVLFSPSSVMSTVHLIATLRSVSVWQKFLCCQKMFEMCL